jgi:hypothetical protein
MQFCKSTTVMTVVLTHYIKLNPTGSISCSVKTDNSCFVQIYCITTHKITQKKETPKQRTLALKNITVEWRTMFRGPTISQTNPAHASTYFNGKYKIEVTTAYPTNGRKNSLFRKIIIRMIRIM